MKALLLAAGLGTRLRPLTNEIPKLVPILGRPLLGYWLDLLFDAGFERVLINTHWLPDAVNDFVNMHVNSDRIDLIHEDQLLGTGGTIRSTISQYGSDDLFVAHADNLTNFDVKGFIQRHYSRPEHCAMTMLSFRTDNPQSCGILELDSQNVVMAFHEKINDPPGNLANGAVYVISLDVLTAIRQFPGSFVDLSTDIIPKFVGRILSVETAGYHRDIGSLESLADAESEFPRYLSSSMKWLV